MPPVGGRRTSKQQLDSRLTMWFGPFGGRGRVGRRGRERRRRGGRSGGFSHGGEGFMMRHSWKVAVLLAGFAGLVAAPNARAGLIPTNVSVTPDGSNLRCTYAVVVPT